jgi:hypothetical protein
MQTLIERKNQIEIGETVKKAVSNWYLENGKPEPFWYMPDPKWWIDYLASQDNN